MRGNGGPGEAPDGTGILYGRRAAWEWRAGLQLIGIDAELPQLRGELFGLRTLTVRSFLFALGSFLFALGLLFTRRQQLPGAVPTSQPNVPTAIVTTFPLAEFHLQKRNRDPSGGRQCHRPVAPLDQLKTFDFPALRVPDDVILRLDRSLVDPELALLRSGIALLVAIA